MNTFLKETSLFCLDTSSSMGSSMCQRVEVSKVNKRPKRNVVIFTDRYEIKEDCLCIDKSALDATQIQQISQIVSIEETTECICIPMELVKDYKLLANVAGVLRIEC